ncbi:sensor histidine kinase [Streptomyces rapamycinicus]|uniref:histidine kinase n=2 Tax=Streptomyces rapamycinicus TaxID=1226757 RepID=A0A0A0NFW3_STRRN|nr:histidine kinase [Streptomyces rapamycinicus]AGP58397.1 ATPase [Streptomyces rapamycinicus NRRL 5491]RLV78440.1 ATPase [Streptomyces rapamycinicus NRRL 5491]UTO68205.1 two-component sensor histidine kinase [Streptomyces rapamycinicus]UTP37405.1 two-component sensor histidine kinase [Streptomyces rapamycinicus NRRL 5491]
MQWVLTLAVIGAGILTIRPMGFSGWGLAVAVLFVLNCLALLARGLPEARVTERVAVVWLSLGIVASAALIATGRGGSTYLFAFFLAGHVGYRLRTRPAVVLALSCSLLCGAVLYFHLGPGHHLVPWEIGLATGVPVLVGIANRSHHQAVRSALSAAESAESAARAEAQAAVLTERSRIARDVHDVLAHSLAGINMQLELADALLDTGDLEKVREANGKAHSLVKESLKQAQWTVHTLREDSLPLLESLTAMLASSGHRDALTVTGTVREVPAQVTQNLLRIAQEALTNAARHAPGGDVGVELTFAASSTTLRIRNRAATRPVDAGVGSGMGLIGMRERVALLNGTLTTGPVTEEPDQGGWQVEAVIPQ